MPERAGGALIERWCSLIGQPPIPGGEELESGSHTPLIENRICQHQSVEPKDALVRKPVSLELIDLHERLGVPPDDGGFVAVETSEQPIQLLADCRNLAPIEV